MQDGGRSNISKSVRRAFDVFELFRQHKVPLTAADLRRSLEMPQPSARALLKNLVDLGYLSFTDRDKTYFPTMRLAQLGDWIGNTVIADVNVAEVIDAIALEAGETASLNVRNDLNLEILYVRTAAHPLGLSLRPGIGEALWLSAAGRALLGALPADERESALQAMISAERNPRSRRKILAIAPLLDEIHAQGYFVGYDIYFEGVGAVCVGTHIGDRRAVVAVAGAKDRIRSNQRRILRIIRAGLRQLHP